MPKDSRITEMRRQLAAAITTSLGANAQEITGPAYGIPQPRMSQLERGVVDRFSLEWLIQRIYVLGGTVRISVELPDAARAHRIKRMRASAARRIARGVGNQHDEWVIREL